MKISVKPPQQIRKLISSKYRSRGCEAVMCRVKVESANTITCLNCFWNVYQGTKAWKWWKSGCVLLNGSRHYFIKIKCFQFNYISAKNERPFQRFTQNSIKHKGYKIYTIFTKRILRVINSTTELNSFFFTIVQYFCSAEQISKPVYNVNNMLPIGLTQKKNDHLSKMDIDN